MHSHSPVADEIKAFAGQHAEVLLPFTVDVWIVIPVEQLHYKDNVVVVPEVEDVIAGINPGLH